MVVFITEFRAERYKRLHAVTIRPDENGLTIIGGDNMAGKTSALNIVSHTLGGDAFCPSNPTNTDASEPFETCVELSNGLTVRRDGKNGSLKVTAADGMKGNQSLLDEFVEKFALNLPKFLEASDKEKAKILLRIIGKGEEIEALDKQEAEFADKRRAAGQLMREAQAQLANMDEVENAPEELVSVADLSKQIEAANKIQKQKDELERENEQRKTDAARLKNDNAGHQEHIAQLQEQIATNETALEHKRDEYQSAQIAIAEIEVPDTDALREQIANAESENARWHESGNRIAKMEEVNEKEFIHSNLEESIINVRQNRQRILDHADMPLEGLTVVNGALSYKRCPWDCMSAAEQLKVGTSIVSKLNPDCGWVLLDKLEQLDLPTLEDFGEWAKSEGLQIIATRVSTGDECSLIIEDGCVKGGEER